MVRSLFIVSALLLSTNLPLYAEERQSSFLDLEFMQQRLYSIDGDNSVQESEKISRRNQRYLRDALESYSRQTLRSIGLADKTVDLMGATLGLATKGAKLNLNQSRTFAIHFKGVGTHDRALYLGYHLDW